MTITAKIFKPVKSPTQSGRAKINKWILEYDLETKRQPEALMGWVASGDTLNQVKITFDTEEEAIAFADKKGMQYAIVEPQARRLKPRTYLDNFK